MRALVSCALACALLAGCGSDDNGRAEPRLIAAVGDSITAGSPGWDPDPVRREQFGADEPESQWEHWAQAKLGERFEFRNCGVPGDRTDEIAARLDACLEDADVAILQGGINDLIQGFAPRDAAENMREMVERAREGGRPVFVANALPINSDDRRITRKIDPQIKRLNALVAGLARAEDATLVDFFATLEDPAGSGRMRPDWTAEGLHPSIEGYRRLGEAVAAACSTNRSCSAR